MTAERLLLVSGIAGFIIILQWVRCRSLREKYAIGWLVLATFFLALSVYPQAIIHFAKWTKLSNATAALFWLLVFLTAFCFSVSVSLSHSHKRNKDLTQQVALLEQRIRKLEEKVNPVEGKDASAGDR